MRVWDSVRHAQAQGLARRILRRLTPRYRRASLLGPQEGFKNGFQNAAKLGGSGVILANLGGLGGSFSSHFGGLGGS